MGLTSKDQLKWWSIGVAVLIGGVWLLGSALAPFIAGAAIAYFLDPLADRLEKMGLSRVWATTIISLLAFMVFLLAGLMIVPLLIDQLTGFVRALPDYIARLQVYLAEHLPSLADKDSTLSKTLVSIQDVLKEKSGVFLKGVLSSSLALFDFMIIVVVTPVVAFYLLLDWDRLVAAVDSWVPREHAPVVRMLALRIDKVLAGFVRGQLTVCTILGTFYALALLIIGLKFGLFVGFIAGLISFIPFVGSIVGGTLSIGLALVQFWDSPGWIVAVAVVFVIGQFVEGHILTPKLVGGSVGLHPVWLMLALSAFGSLFGFVGLLIAVPVAAGIGVLGRFAMEKYLQGPLYRGPEDPDEA